MLYRYNTDLSRAIWHIKAPVGDTVVTRPAKKYRWNNWTYESHVKLQSKCHPSGINWNKTSLLSFWVRQIPSNPLQPRTPTWSISILLGCTAKICHIGPRKRSSNEPRDGNDQCSGNDDFNRKESGWWFYPSWKIWVRQWEGWHPIYYGK